MSTAYERKATEMALASGKAPTSLEVATEVLAEGLEALSSSSSVSQATQPEAEAGTEAALRSWSPLRVGEAVAALSQGPAIIIRAGFSGESSTQQALSQGSWGKIIFNASVSGGSYIDLAGGIITPPAGFGLISTYCAIKPVTTKEFMIATGVWVNGSESHTESIRASDLVVPDPANFDGTIPSSSGIAVESTAYFTSDGTKTFELRAWVGVASHMMSYFKSGTRMVLLWFPS